MSSTTSLMRQQGFSLVEILVTLSLLGIFILLELPTTAGSYGKAIRRADFQLLVSALKEARSESIHEICRNPDCTYAPSHGVFITQNSIIIFEGNSYASRYIPADNSIRFSLAENFAASSSEVLFAPGTGNSSSSSILFISPGQRQQFVTINSEGMISP